MSQLDGGRREGGRLEGYRSEQNGDHDVERVDRCLQTDRSSEKRRGARPDFLSAGPQFGDAGERSVEVLKQNEWNTSKTRSDCSDDRSSNRVEHGLYVCESYGMLGNADCNAAENMRQKITLSPHGEAKE